MEKLARKLDSNLPAQTKKKKEKSRAVPRDTERENPSLILSLGQLPTNQPSPIPRTSRGPHVHPINPHGIRPEISTGTAAMRLIVPLQGVVQGRGGLIWGSLIPCALFYFLQLYLKRRRPPSPSSNPLSPSQSFSDLQRSSSRSNLSTRGSIGRVRISSRASSIAKPNDSPYYVGLDKTKLDPYDRCGNPNGVIQLGLAENRVSTLGLGRFALLLDFGCEFDWISIRRSCVLFR